MRSPSRPTGHGRHGRKRYLRPKFSDQVLNEYTKGTKGKGRETCQGEVDFECALFTRRFACTNTLTNLQMMLSPAHPGKYDSSTGTISEHMWHNLR